MDRRYGEGSNAGLEVITDEREIFGSFFQRLAGHGNEGNSQKVLDVGLPHFLGKQG
jgi:hypothetical protein